MDHLSLIVKLASRGQWLVNTLRSPTFTISKPTKLPLSSFIPSLSPPPGPAGRQQQWNTGQFYPCFNFSSRDYISCNWNKILNNIISYMVKSHEMDSLWGPVCTSGGHIIILFLKYV